MIQTPGTRYRGWRAPLRATVLTVLAAAGLASSAPAIQRTYQYFRFTPTVPAPGALIQLSEFRFFNGATALPLGGVTVENINGAAQSPGGEAPPLIIDGNTATKWLNYNNSGTAGLIFNFGSAVTIDRYDFATANDALGRTPTHWTLEGSANGTDWALIDQVTANPVPGTLFTYIPQIVLQPVIMQSFTTPQTVVLDNTVIDLSWSTLLATNISIQPGDLTGLPASGLESVTPAAGADTLYTLTASNGDGSATAKVQVRSVAGGASNFRYVRFTPVKLRNNASANSIQVSELRMLSGVTVLTPVSVTNPGGNTPLNEGPANLYDDNIGTKWLDFNKQGVVLDFGAPVSFDGYYLATANDAPERDPVRWTFEGSNDGTSWTLVENMTAFDFPVSSARGAYTQDIPLPGASIKPAVTLGGNAVKLVDGEPLVLTWSTQAAATVSIDNGVGPVAASGTVVVTPSVDTTYTLTATAAGGAVTTATFAVEVIDPAITTINYPDFDDAGEELVLLGTAQVLNAFAQFPAPGNAKRLRLNDDLGSQAGSAWFAKKVHLDEGFQTFFDLQFITLGTSSGADGMSFSIQNTPQGNGAVPSGPAEEGLPGNALNIKFDSYDNGDADPSAAVVQVRAGSTPVATADLNAFPELLPLPGTDPADLTMNSGNTAPYQVRVDYVPGDLDVYFNNVLVIDSASVDLAAIGALDASGKAYVGFSGRAGGQFEAHDVTRWLLTEGPPAAPAAPLVIKDFAFNFTADTLQLTWGSSDTRTYKVTASNDGIDWSTTLASGIAGASGQQETSTTVNFTQGTVQLFRVEEE
jgi:hypothetical protein